MGSEPTDRRWGKSVDWEESNAEPLGQDAEDNYVIVYLIIGIMMKGIMMNGGC